IELGEHTPTVGEFHHGAVAQDETTPRTPTFPADDPIHLQLVQGLSHRHAGDAELLGEVTFRRQPVAGGERIGLDPGDDLSGDPGVGGTRTGSHVPYSAVNPEVAQRKGQGRTPWASLRRPPGYVVRGRHGHVPPTPRA